MKESSSSSDRERERVKVKSACGQSFILTVKLIENGKENETLLFGWQHREHGNSTQLYGQSIKNRIQTISSMKGNKYTDLKIAL